MFVKLSVVESKTIKLVRLIYITDFSGCGCGNGYFSERIRGMHCAMIMRYTN